jgi:hypothetical protein
VDGSQVGIFKEGDQVSFGGFLESTNGRGLETQVSLEVLSNFTDKTLERKLADQKLSGLLVTTDFTKSDGTGSVTMGLLDTTSRGGRLTGSLGSELLTGGLTTGGFTSSLLSTSHFLYIICVGWNKKKILKWAPKLLPLYIHVFGDQKYVCKAFFSSYFPFKDNKCYIFFIFFF